MAQLRLLRLFSPRRPIHRESLAGLGDYFCRRKASFLTRLLPDWYPAVHRVEPDRLRRVAGRSHMSRYGMRGARFRNLLATKRRDGAGEAGGSNGSYDAEGVEEVARGVPQDPGNGLWNSRPPGSSGWVCEQLPAATHEIGAQRLMTCSSQRSRARSHWRCRRRA